MPNDWLSQQPEEKVEAALVKLRADGEGRAKQYVDYAHGDEYFALWLTLVDGRCLRRFGMSIFDLGDALWRDKFDAGDSPKDALQEAMEDDDMGSMMLADLGEE